jgi:hypothetical protein
MTLESSNILGDRQRRKARSQRHSGRSALVGGDAPSRFAWNWSRHREDYALIDKFSRSSGRVRAVGLLARATFWECIAIPDIRVQCQHLAEIIAKKSAL